MKRERAVLATVDLLKNRHCFPGADLPPHPSADSDQSDSFSIFIE